MCYLDLIPAFCQDRLKLLTCLKILVRKNTLKPVNKGHPREGCRLSLLTSGLYLDVKLFYLIKVGLLKCDLYLQGGLYKEVTLNTGLTVFLNLYMIYLFFL